MTNPRPSSRVSNHSAPPPLPIPSRPSSSLSYARPISAFGHAPKTPAAERFGGLADKEFSKIQMSVSAARTIGRSRSGYSKNDHEDILESNELSFRGEVAPEGSFVADTSFSRAPLNSRLAPISPRRVAINPPASQRVLLARSRLDAKGKGKLVERHEEDEDDSDRDGGGERRMLDDDSQFTGDEEEDEELVEAEKEQKKKRERVAKESLQGLSPELQEAFIVEDLLFVLMGIEGQYIEYDDSYDPQDELQRLNGADFIIDPQLLPWLTELVRGFLPIAKYFTATKEFVEQYSVLEFGVINHALCAAIREIHRDYLVLISQLEHSFLTSSTFSLRTFWYHLNPTLHKLSLLHSLTSSLVTLSTYTPPEDSFSHSSSASSSSDSEPENEQLAAIAREMKAARAGIRASASSTPGGKNWDGGIVKGGEVLFLINERLETLGGNPMAKELFESLLKKAGKPYKEILVKWIKTGLLADPWEEFLVREAKGINRGSLEDDYMDEYWEKRYTLRDSVSSIGSGKGGGGGPRTRGLAGGAVVPQGLERWKMKVLLAGKYLNVIRECGIEIKGVVEEEGEGEGEDDGGMNDEEFYRKIDEAYTYANKLLLQLLITEQHLLPRLQSIKRYFFLDPADVFTHFLDMASLELPKKMRQASITKLQSMLELALRNPSSAYADPFKDDLSVTLHNTTLIDWLVKVNKVGGGEGEGFDKLGNGLMEEKRKEDKEGDEKSQGALITSEALTFDYLVRFPLNLVLSKKTILRYQLIFRYLLQLKLVERTLVEEWKEQTKSQIWRRRSIYPELEEYKLRVCALRNRMFTFVQQMYSFAVGEVLEPNWRQLEKKLEKVETVDGLLKDHVDFLDDCLNALLLTADEKILGVLDKLIKVCSLFGTFSASFTKSVTVATATSDAKGSWSASTFKRSWDTFEKFELNFNHHSKTLEERVGFTANRENTALLPLQVRLKNLTVDKERNNREESQF